MSQPERFAYSGLSQIAHAIRRSTALYVATMLLPEGSTDAELYAKADALAGWIGGAALRQEGERQQPKDEFLGLNPWEG